MNPPIKYKQNTFFATEGQAKFTLKTQEDADRMLK
jgi:hypothetical protein